MLKLDFYHTLYIGISQVFLGIFVMLLIDFRKPVSKWRTRWSVTAVLIVGSNLIGLLFLNFWEIYSRAGLFTVTLPYILVTLWCSQYRDFRAAFSIITGLFVGCIGTANEMLTELLLQHTKYCEYYSFAVRVISFFLMFFILRRFSATYRQMLHQLNRSWGILCLIPFSVFITMLYAISNSANSVTIIVLFYGLLVACSGAYYLMCLFFDRVQKENSARYEAQLSTLQVSALRNRMEAVRVAENAIRTERHDLRHRLQAVAELVSRGDKKSALEFLDAAQRRLDEQKEIRWCRPPVLDAVFSSYFDQAKNQGILVEANIALPDTLPVDEGALAIVLANALENAIHANLKVPQGQRQIRCKMVATPSVILEISNPCAGDVSFDGDGLPITRQSGHGLGVQSISAFCRKNGAVCHFDLTDDWFRLRLVL